jgi:hypothetical protein
MTSRDRITSTRGPFHPSDGAAGGMVVYKELIKSGFKGKAFTKAKHGNLYLVERAEM